MNCNSKYKTSLLLITLILLVRIGYGQSSFRTQKFVFKDSIIKLDTLSISPFDFRILVNGTVIDESDYKIDFSRSILTYNSKKKTHYLLSIACYRLI